MGGFYLQGLPKPAEEDFKLSYASGNSIWIHFWLTNHPTLIFLMNLGQVRGLNGSECCTLVRRATVSCSKEGETGECNLSFRRMGKSFFSENGVPPILSASCTSLISYCTGGRR